MTRAFSMLMSSLLSVPSRRDSLGLSGSPFAVPQRWWRAADSPRPDLSSRPYLKLRSFPWPRKTGQGISRLYLPWSTTSVSRRAEAKALNLCKRFDARNLTQISHRCKRSASKTRMLTKGNIYSARCRTSCKPKVL